MNGLEMLEGMHFNPQQCDRVIEAHLVVELLLPLKGSLREFQHWKPSTDVI